MPFDSYDPAKEFSCYHGLAVPDGICIPTSDSVAWSTFPAYRKVYNKLEVALSQGLAAAPNGVTPQSFPVFMKPIYNMWNWGKCSYLIRSKEEYAQHHHPGLFWMEYLEGPHLSTDFILIGGKVVWDCTFQGHPLHGGTFDYWETVALPDGLLEYLTAWCTAELDGYTGSVNFETIGGKIIEVHLRMGDIDKFANRRLMEQIVALYQHGTWSFAETLPKLYIFALFGQHEVIYRVDNAKAAAACEEVFCWRIWENIDLAQNHQHPPGGVRLAQLCSTEYHSGYAAREALRTAFAPVPLGK